MRSYLGCGVLGSVLALSGCAQTTTSFVKSDTTLGRVVVYRNGVAYFERYAEVQGDSLKLNVPTDKVDDFLKSLTVVDAATGEPAPISYPSGEARAGGEEGGTIDMKIGVGRATGNQPHRLRLSYVTEAPSWKPSYRVVLGKTGKLDLQGWAIVDNTSGEDWKDVHLGVGASSAMSFRYDLKGLRIVDRETLQANDLFAQAPPMGGASYGQQPGAPRKVVGDMSDDALAMADFDETKAPASAPRPVIMSGHAVTVAKAGPRRPEPVAGAAAAPPPQPNKPTLDALARMARSINAGASGQQVIVEGYASSGDKDKMGASLERANKLRDQLVRQGVDASRIIALGKGEQAGRSGGARVVEAAVVPEAPKEVSAADKPREPTVGKPPSEPIGTSHFESTSAMTVPKGTSAMVSILRTETEGEVVYLFDPESARGNAKYPFRTLRFRNPTGSALESGPVSVFGEGRFIGEGLAEPIPAHSIAFVPFALDRQVVVEQKDADRDDIARILTVNRGVFSTEIRHTKKTTFALYNRQGEKATVYVKHTVTPGYKLTKFPDTRSPVPGAGDSSDHLSGANLFRVDIEPNAKVDIDIEETTPVYRTTDIRTQAGLDMVRAYLSHAAALGPLKTQVEQLLKLNVDMTKIEQEISTVHEQMGEYRQRMDELHAQLVTLKAVKTAGPLMTHLEKKLQEMSERLSKSTVDVVVLQEKLMVARVQFQAGVADLSLEQKSEATASN